MDLTISKKALHVTAVTKTFNIRSNNPVHAVKNISFTVDAGEVVGLIGPNGAGKTTLLRILLGFLDADSGAVSIFGEHPESMQARQMLGYQADSQFRSNTITVNRFFNLHRALIGKEATAEQLTTLLEHFSLIDARNRKLSTMSKGMRQKIELVQAFLGNPQIVFLDEPTAALDPPSVFELRELLEHRKQQGTTIFFSSHNLTEVEHVCDRVLFITKGEITAEFSIKNVEPGYLEEMFRVHIVEKKKL